MQIIGSSGRYLYYWAYNAMGNQDSLNCYDMEEQQEKAIYTGKASRLKTTAVEENGSLYIPLYVQEQNAQPQYLHVADGQVLSITDQQMTYQSENLEYYAAAYYHDAVERVIIGGEQVYATDDHCRIDVLNLQGEVISTLFEVK